jgi:DNA-binding NarL/FixJ family response regulator
MKDIIWNKIILDEFIKLAILTETEERILRTRIAGWSRVKQSMELNLSVSTVDCIIRMINQKYDMVQPYSEILPKRKKKQ